MLRRAQVAHPGHAWVEMDQLCMIREFIRGMNSSEAINTPSEVDNL